MSELKVPPLDLGPEIEELWDELQAALQAVLRSTRFILGPNVQALEREIAAHTGAAHGVGVNSGTDALVIALRALGVGPGDEVIAPSFTFFATTEAVDAVGARPVFADVDETSFNIDPAAVEALVTPSTKAIIPVHLFGCPADMDALGRIAGANGIALIEDAAQAYGGAIGERRVGTFGRLTAYSFFPTKNLGCYGDGGMIVTDDEALAAQCRMLRAHGGKQKYANEILGYNSRLDELQAAILRVKLPHVDAWNDRRRAVAARYFDAFRAMDGITPPEDPADRRHVFHQYTVRIAGGRRDAVRESLAAAGIGSMVYYPTPVHRLPVYAGRTHPALPVTEMLAEEVLSLPIFPHLTEDRQDLVIDAVLEAVRAA
jgi:dTDP-4-amino-4,6-dideoxygalactose transaminase